MCGYMGCTISISVFAYPVWIQLGRTFRDLPKSVDLVWIHMFSMESVGILFMQRTAGVL